MNRQGRTWLLTLCLVLGAAGLWLWAGGGPIEPSRPPLLASPDEVLGLKLAPVGGEALAFRRVDEGFRLTAPVETPADAQKVQSLLEQIAALGPGEAVEQGEKPTSTFGLDPPGWTLEFTTSAGERRLELGSESSFDGRSYLRVDGKELVLVSTALARRLDPRPKHWREKRIVPDPPESLDYLRFQEGELDLTLVRRSGKWRRVAPTEADPKQGIIRSLIRTLTETRAVDFGEALALPIAESTAGEARIEVGRGEHRRSIELHRLDLDAREGILARGTPLAPWVRLNPSAFHQIRVYFLGLSVVPPEEPGTPD